MGCRTTLIVCHLVLAAAAPASAQAPADANLLITEMRALRHAVETLATTGLRIQVAFGRLQLQEQRTNTAAERLDAIRKRLTDLSIFISGMSDEVKQFEQTITTTRDREELQQATGEAAYLKSQIARSETERARIAIEESDAAGLLASEQSRWSELNSLLDELERSLARTPR